MAPPLELAVDPHPLLDLGAFVTELPGPLGDLPVPEPVRALLSVAAPAPLVADDEVRGAVRDLLRRFGYKPTGRGKPASEYLLRAAAPGGLGSINLAVDVANAVSLHSGLPISVVDLDRLNGPLAVRLGRAGEGYIFNGAAQVIDVAGLPCLVDGEGPCANAVKDAQRTKTAAATRRTLSLVWGAGALGDRTARAVAWYRELLGAAGASTGEVA